jgi:type I restriction enzyme S subunit
VDVSISDDSYLRVGDIVLARTGASVGKSYAYREEDGTMVHAGYLIRIRPNSEFVDRLYLTHFLSSPDYWTWVAEVSGRGAQPGINSTQISELLVPLPPERDGHSPLAEQQKIAQTLSSITDLVRAQAEAIEALQNHKLGLLQQLFPVLDEVDG